METTEILKILKPVVVILAAFSTGKWFAIERNKVQAKGEKWYKAFLTIPGIVILIAIAIPVIMRIFK